LARVGFTTEATEGTKVFGGWRASGLTRSREGTKFDARRGPRNDAEIHGKGERGNWRASGLTRRREGTKFGARRGPRNDTEIHGKGEQGNWRASGLTRRREGTKFGARRGPRNDTEIHGKGERGNWRASGLTRRREGTKDACVLKMRWFHAKTLSTQRGWRFDYVFGCCFHNSKFTIRNSKLPS
jgi:hypothetical protein